MTVHMRLSFWEKMTSKLGSGKFAEGGIGLGSLKFRHGYSALSADVHGGFRKQWAQDGAAWIPCPPSPFSFAICSSNFSQVSQRSLLLIICVVSLASWKVGVHEQDSTRHPIHCFSYSVSPYNDLAISWHRLGILLLIWCWLGFNSHSIQHYLNSSSLLNLYGL